MGGLSSDGEDGVNGQSMFLLQNEMSKTQNKFNSISVSPDRVLHKLESRFFNTNNHEDDVKMRQFFIIIYREGTLIKT